MPRSREAQRQAQAVKYREYQDLCEQHGVERQSARWVQHRYELLNDSTLPFRRKTVHELKRWWLERYTLDEIRQMAGALEGCF